MTTRLTALLSVTLALLLLLLAPGAAEASWSEARTERYIAGDGGPLIPGTAQCITRPSSGAACFGYVWADTVEITIEDDSGRPVGGIAQITYDGGWSRVTRVFCGTSGPIHVPVEAKGSGLVVYLDAPGDVHGAHWGNGPGCTEIGGVTTAGATTGRVHATFSSAE